MYNLPVQFVLYTLLKQPHGFSLQQLAASECDAALVLHLHGVLHEIVILDEDLVLLEPLLVASVRVPDHTRAVSIKNNNRDQNAHLGLSRSLRLTKLFQKGVTGKDILLFLQYVEIIN